ncbi:YceI family protein [Mangrovivirga sp. M17]|uniref:YceI family protein n=1 Tax=Mangrovivirga halotolerans TaxID=2993936 RepID=A0ABT3RWE6_9BACT|nr:YceI family protein [Mangrovivirga halotolerans]MCX2745968.1 YceI family protein [Mangrovivirga halotolerans]
MIAHSRTTLRSIENISFQKLFSFLVLFSANLIVAQSNGDDDSQPFLLDIKLLEESSLGIFVETNVNSFVCEFQDENTYNKTLFKGIIENGGTDVTFRHGIINLPVVKFDCGKNMMNNDFRELLKSEKYPNIKLEFLKAIWYDRKNLNAEADNGEELGYFLVNLTVAGKTQQEKVNIYTTETKPGQLKCTGKIKINMKEFGLEPPVKFLGTVKVKEHIEIRFNLHFIRL